MGTLSGKVAAVTGAAVGLGRAIAIAFGEEGARVVVNFARSSGDAQETATRVRQAGGEALVVQADVSKDAQVRHMMEQIGRAWGRIDVLVNNAGIATVPPIANLDAITEEAWNEQLDVHVKGTFYCCRAVAETMRQQGDGCIINMASVAGIAPVGSSLVYSTSKAAVIHLSKCLARMLGPEIRVNAIAPGFIADTRANQNRPDLDERRRTVIQTSALKRVGSARDVADLAVFLATKAPFMSGTVITLDGGRVFH
jgi:3-oxoacyl-[acyl-carrier protein] reductase